MDKVHPNASRTEYAWAGMPLCEHGYQFDCDVCEDIPPRYSTEQLARVIRLFGDLHLARRFPLPDDVADCVAWARELLGAQIDGREEPLTCIGCSGPMTEEESDWGYHPHCAPDLTDENGSPLPVHSKTRPIEQEVT